MKVSPDKTVSVTIGTLSSGQGHETSFVQLLSEWLGVAPEAVTLVTGDSDLVTAGGGSHSGRSMRHAATTVRRATNEIVAKGCRIAAHLLGADAADISFADGTFRLSGSNRSVDLFEVAAAAALDASLPEDLRGSLQATGEVESRVSSFPYGCHVAEVEIDTETGQVTLARYTAIDDVGRAVNPMIVEGQTHGGIAQGFGEALMERCVYDSNGQLLTASFMDYAMPRAADLPMFQTAISEVPSTTHPLGLRGGGEGGITPALGVIANAIVDGLRDLGVTHVELPATPERIWRAIQERTHGTVSADVRKLAPLQRRRSLGDFSIGAYPPGQIALDLCHLQANPAKSDVTVGAQKIEGRLRNLTRANSTSLPGPWGMTCTRSRSRNSAGTCTALAGCPNTSRLKRVSSRLLEQVLGRTGPLAARAAARGSGRPLPVRPSGRPGNVCDSGLFG